MQNYCETYCGTCKACRAGVLEQLRLLLPVGTPVFTLQTHHSDSGMTHDIAVFIAMGEEILDVSKLIIDAGLGRQAPRTSRGIRVRSSSLDAGFPVVHNVSRALHGDGRALKHRWL